MIRARIAAFAVIAAAASPAWAQDAKPTEGKIDADFTWINAQGVTIARGGEEAAQGEVTGTVTGRDGGLFDGLAMHCIVTSASDRTTYAYSLDGSCVMQDADGDQIFETTTEAGDGSSPGVGKGVITGGTGKFAGLTGEYDYNTIFYGAIEGVAMGVGEKHGAWRLEAE